MARASDARVVLTIHGQYVDDLGETLPSYDAIIAVSPQIADHVRACARVDSSRVHVIPNAVDPDCSPRPAGARCDDSAGSSG